MLALTPKSITQNDQPSQPVFGVVEPGPPRQLRERMRIAPLKRLGRLAG